MLCFVFAIQKCVISLYLYIYTGAVYGLYTEGKCITLYTGVGSKVTPNPWTSTCSTNTTEQNSKAVRPQADLGPDVKLFWASFTGPTQSRVSN